MGHEAEEPDNGVLGRLLEALHGGGVALVGGGIELHTVVSEAPFLLGEPLGVVGEIRKNEVADDGDDESNNTLENEEPLPASKTLEGVSEERVVWRREAVAHQDCHPCRGKCRQRSDQQRLWQGCFQCIE